MRSPPPENRHGAAAVRRTDLLEKNGIYETVITDYTAEGQGIAHIEGIAVFIPNAIAGERVQVRIETVRKPKGQVGLAAHARR